MTLREISRYTILENRLSNAVDMLKSMQKASQPESVTVELMPRSLEVRNKIGNLDIEIEDMTNRIEQLKCEIKRENLAINKFINSIYNERIRMAMRLKFIRRLTWEQTADILGNNCTVEGIKHSVYKYLTPQTR